MNVVWTRYGKIRGVIENGVSVFKGIPYAQPPVGALRWRAPQPPKTWEGELLADHFSPVPVQPVFPGDREMGALPMSEDCLYLNIWAPPISDGTRFPVVVWIYGGAYQSGAASLSVYDGARFAKEECVFVSFNYRVGPMGFFAHPSLAVEDPEGLSGNYGTQDQAAALRWVHENIEAFGGDPGRVTLLGQSAGAHSVMTMCVSPRTEGMISGAIIQSTAGLSPLYYQDEKSVLEGCEEGKRQLEKLGVSSIAEARALNAETVLERLKGEHWFPKTGGSLLPEGTITALMRGHEKKISYLIGFTSAEAGSMPGFWKGASPESIRGFGEKCFPKDPDGYMRTLVLSSPEEIRAAAFDQYGNDKICAGIAWQSLRISRGDPIYQYYLTRPVRDREGNLVPPFHAGELPYVFGTMDGQYDDADRAFSETVGRYWINFIKTGDPGDETLPRWEKSRSAAEAMILGEKIGMGAVLMDETKRFIVQYMLKEAAEKRASD